MREIDESNLMDCPEEECDGFLMRTNLPSEDPTYKCVVCGLVTWDTPEVLTNTLHTGFTLTVEIFQVTNWSPTK